MGVTAIIPAYNEGNTIKMVLDSVKQVEQISDIIVVSDGSTDNTAEVAAECGVRVIKLTENIGKGGAIKAGVCQCKTETILFLDADLVGLTKEHVTELIMPVINDEADMTVGLFKNGRRVTDLAQKVTPYLSGQRAIKKAVFDQMPNIDAKYGVEVAMTKYVENHPIRVKAVYLEDMTHITKEEKLGVIKGVQARFKMYWEIVKILGTYDIKERQSKKR